MRLTHQRASRSRRAFTLLELLLVSVLLLALTGAVVFSFTGLQRGAQLDEGVSRMETLIHLARAHAANSGRVVKVVFTPDASDDGTPGGTVVSVQVQSEPGVNRDAFVELAETRAESESVGELVQIVNVGTQSAEPSAGTTEASAAAPAEATAAETPASATGVQQITFYPDGSSDSAELILTSRDAEDSRRVSLKLTGITGATRRLVLPEAEASQP